MRPGLAGCTLAVLAGGEGSRMGRPKGLLAVTGVPILAHLLDRLAWPGPTLLVTAPGRERPPGWDRFDAEAVDAAADEGPLRGVLTALEASGTPLVAVTTVDMPGVVTEQFRWLAERMGPSDLGVMTDRELEGQRQVEPFPCLLRTAAATRVRDRLAGRRRSVHALAGERGFVVRAAPPGWPASAWANLNTPADLDRYETTGDA